MMQGSAARAVPPAYNRCLFSPRQFPSFCFILLVFLSTASTQAKSSEVSQAQIIMQNGKEVILTSPIKISGTFSNSEIVIKRLSIKAVESIVLQEKLKKRNIYQLSLRENDKNFLVLVNKNAKVSGNGEWGKESISLVKINTLKLSYDNTGDKIDRKYKWLARLKSGKNIRMSLSPRVNFAGFLKTEGNSNKFSVNGKYVKSISFADNKSHIYDSKDTLLLAGWQPGKTTLPGKTWFGSVDLKWDQIDALENLAPTQKTPASAAQHRFVLDKGTEIILPILSINNLQGKIEDIILDVDIKNIVSISRSPEQNKQFTLSFPGDLKYANFQPQGKRFIASAYFGKLDIPWGSLVSFSQTKPSKKENIKFRTTWSLTTKRGMEFGLQNLKLNTSRRNKGVLNGEIQVEVLNTNMIRKFVPGSEGLDFQIDEDSFWSLNGMFAAESKLGKVTFNTSDVAKLLKVGTLKSRKYGSEKSKGGAGKLITTSGREYLVRNLTINSLKKINSRKAYWGNKLVKISLGQMELWIAPKKLSSASFKKEGQNVIFDMPEFGWPVASTNVKKLSFQTDLGKFNIQSKSLKSFVSSSKIEAKKNTGKSTIRIQASYKNQSSPFVEITGIQFARYPALGWSGFYTKRAYPFQWWRANKLFFTRANDGTRIDVEFDKISSIDILERYRKNRKAVLTNRNGKKLKGAIYPGDVAKSHGTSTWDYSKEGLLGKISNDTYIFIRFNKVTKINIEYD